VQCREDCSLNESFALGTLSHLAAAAIAAADSMTLGLLVGTFAVAEWETRGEGSPVVATESCGLALPLPGLVVLTRPGGETWVGKGAASQDFATILALGVRNDLVAGGTLVLD